MDIAVLGCGRWGRNVIRTLRELETGEDVRLRDVVHTGNENRGRQIEKDHQLNPHTRVDKAIERNDAVCVVTPDDTHPSLTRRVLNHETDVFVEKPLAFDRDEARDLFLLAREQDALLMVGHLMLFHPLLSELSSRKTFRVQNLQEVAVTRLSNLREAGERRLPHSSLIHDITVLDAVFEAVPDTVTVHEADGPYPPGRFLNARLDYGTTPVRIRARSDWCLPERSLSFRSKTHHFHFDGLEETLTILKETGKTDDTDTIQFDSLPLTEELRNFVRASRSRESCLVTSKHVLRVMETLDRLERRILETLAS